MDVFCLYAEKCMANEAKTKNDELYTIHKTFQRLQPCSAVDLRKQLEADYPEIWEKTGRACRSDERKIKRALDKLIEYGIANKYKEGRETIYSYIYDNSTENSHKIAGSVKLGFDGRESYYKRITSVVSMLNDMSPYYYLQTQNERIDNKEKIIKTLETAIDKRLKIRITYKGNQYIVAPLKIALLDGYWYLIAYNIKYFTYRIKDMVFVEFSNENYEVNAADDIELDEWMNSWHQPDQKSKKITLFIDNVAFPFFKDKNILGVERHKDRLTPFGDGWEYECIITHHWELLPILMQWQKHVAIIEEEEGAGIIDQYKDILENALGKLPLR